MDSHPRNGSPIWNAIAKSKHILREGYHFRIGDGSSLFWYTPWVPIGPLFNHVFAVDIHDAGTRIKDVYQNNTWHLDRLCTDIPIQLRTQITATQLFLHGQVPDGFIWDNIDGTYIAKSGYHIFGLFTSLSKIILLMVGAGSARCRGQRRSRSSFGWKPIDQHQLSRSYITDTLLQAIFALDANSQRKTCYIALGIVLYLGSSGPRWVSLEVSSSSTRIRLVGFGMASQGRTQPYF